MAPRMLPLRRHQQETLQLVQELRQGREIDYALHWVTPGGGKSLLPVIYASGLQGGLFDRLCWLVPRDSLRKQAAEAFTTAGNFVDATGQPCLNPRLRVREAVGYELDPARGWAGYVTTYQSVARYPDLHQQEFKRARYALVLDEPHHLAHDASWEAAVKALWELATVRVLMTGTVERHDARRVAFLDYDRREDGGWELVTFDHARRPVIRCSRREALAEQSIIEVALGEADGHARFVNTEGDLRAIEAFTEIQPGEERDAVDVTLDPKYATELLMTGAEAWQQTLRTRPLNQLLVAAHRQEVAKEYQRKLQLALGMEVLVAVSEDGPAAQRAIEAFRRRQTLILVTVGMAYEGMDAVGISHEIILSAYRSRPWIDQLAGRAVRPDPLARVPFDQQVATIYAPNDPLMREILRGITEEQRAAARDPRVPIDPPSGPRGPRELGEGEGDAVGPLVLDAGLTAVAWRQLFGLTPRTPGEEEQYARQQIERRTRRIDRSRGVEAGTTNREIRETFGKPREAMTLAELGMVWGFLNQRYPDA